MRKFFGIIAITTIAAAGWNFNLDQNEVELSDLALANVEALARNEGDAGPGTKKCYITVTEASKDDFLAVEIRRCGGCTPMWATSCADRALC